MTLLTLSQGGADFPAVQTLYWQGLRAEAELKPTLAELTRRGLLEYDLDEDRYLLHPAVRPALVTKRLTALPPADQQRLKLDHAEYYLDIARQYERTPPHQWHQFEPDWANIRQGVETVTQQLEDLAGASVQDLLATVDSVSHLDVRQPRDLTLVRDYALALRTYCVQRQPPSGFRWLTAGLVAAQALGDSWSR
ncbi:MAG: hypothetical protein GTO49_24425, partial [Anaerolineae bacterium]|nr:hypothetical protein [Anaerolineae bacterium]